MAGRGSARYLSSYGLGSSSRRPFTGVQEGPSISPDIDELPPGDLIAILNAADISSSSKDGPARLSNFKCIASYNWLDSSKPIILVPGSPPIWSPPVLSRKLPPDQGEVFIDQNTARYSSFPLEPMFRAIYEMCPDRDLGDVDVIICRNTMVKLFDFVTTNSKTFEIDVEIIGDKALFIRKEKKLTEFISDFRGFGRTFPEEYTRWDSAAKGSSSHHRIVEFDLTGLKYLLRCESNGYLQEVAGNAETVPSHQKGGMSNPADFTTSLDTSDLLSIGEKRPIKGNGLTVRNGGSEIDQGAIIEIKTRAAHKVLDMETVLPRLWMSQTSNLIVAYHKASRFDNVQILNVRKDIQQWEERNSVNIRKLNVIIRRIITTVKSTSSMKCRVKTALSGGMEIWELDGSNQGALPDDLSKKLSKEDLEKEDHCFTEPGNLASDDDEIYYCDGECEDYYKEDDDESDKDYTACNADDCGYCGHCHY